MHKLFGNNSVRSANRPKIIMGTEITMAVAKGVVHLGHKGTGFALQQRDPEADGIEMHPQKTGLGQQ